jgi:hypothetical protein
MPPEDAKRLYRRFRSLRVPAAVDPSIYLHAARFEIAVGAAMNAADFVVYGGAEQRRAHPLLKWATAVVESVSRHKPKR